MGDGAGRPQVLEFLGAEEKWGLLYNLMDT